MDPVGCDIEGLLGEIVGELGGVRGEGGLWVGAWAAVTQAEGRFRGSVLQRYLKSGV